MKNKTLFVKPLMLPPSICLGAKEYSPKEDITFFLGNNTPPATTTTVQLKFLTDVDRKKTTKENKKIFMDFYGQVQLQHDGYFLANAPVFTDKRTYLFRFGNSLSHNYLDNSFTENCLVYCCWEYAEGVVDYLDLPPTGEQIDPNETTVPPELTQSEVDNEMIEE